MISDGSRALVVSGASLNAIASLTGATKSSAARWKRGECIPGELARSALRTAFGIEPHAWQTDTVRLQDSTVPAQPKPHYPAAPEMALPALATDGYSLSEYPSSPPHSAPLIEQYRYRLRCLSLDLTRQGLRFTDRLKLYGESRSLIAEMSKLEREGELTTDAVVYRHPKFLRLRGIILGALDEYPKAQEAVTAAFNPARKKQKS